MEPRMNGQDHSRSRLDFDHFSSQWGASHSSQQSAAPIWDHEHQLMQPEMVTPTRGGQQLIGQQGALPQLNRNMDSRRAPPPHLPPWPYHGFISYAPPRFGFESISVPGIDSISPNLNHGDAALPAGDNTEGRHGTQSRLRGPIPGASLSIDLVLNGGPSPGSSLEATRSGGATDSRSLSSSDMTNPPPGATSDLHSRAFHSVVPPSAYAHSGTRPAAFLDDDSFSPTVPTFTPSYPRYSHQPTWNSIPSSGNLINAAATAAATATATATATTPVPPRPRLQPPSLQHSPPSVGNRRHTVSSDHTRTHGQDSPPHERIRSFHAGGRFRPRRLMASSGGPSRSQDRDARSTETSPSTPRATQDLPPRSVASPDAFMTPTRFGLRAAAYAAYDDDEDMRLERQQREMQLLRGSISSKQVASKAALQSLQSIEIADLPESERTCAICYNEYGVESPEKITEIPKRLPKCLHVFGDHCIKKWLADADHCPYCREKLPSQPQHSMLRPMPGSDDPEAIVQALIAAEYEAPERPPARRSPPADDIESQRRTRQRLDHRSRPGVPMSGVQMSAQPFGMLSSARRQGSPGLVNAGRPRAEATANTPTANITSHPGARPLHAGIRPSSAPSYPLVSPSPSHVIPDTPAVREEVNARSRTTSGRIAITDVVTPRDSNQTPPR